MHSADAVLRSRHDLAGLVGASTGKCEEEGGCGVTGFISSVPVSGKNIFEPSVQMHNRGNGKGGGIAAVGFIPEALGVSRRVLDEDYLLQIALLDPKVEREIEREFIKPHFKVDMSGRLPVMDDHRDLGLEVKPPEVQRYFVRVKDEVLDAFIRDQGLAALDRRAAEDEFIYRNSFTLNSRLYASLGEKRAFVLSHGRDMMILKIVGYAENVVKYYKLDDFKAHVWLAHQRYPTRGRVWHPGGCHPFSALNEALVHNGDFANYQSVKDYLRQRDYHLLFLTDTEEAALLLDLWGRVYQYPLEYLIEAMAPTSEMDFDMLPAKKQKIYKAIQTHHAGSSPDGPWFFIIAANDTRQRCFRLIGITDTSMLRPQVFALQEGEVQVGLICSEKQAIDATLKSLGREDERFRPIADKYWNARGGSHTDGGAFIFSLLTAEGGEKKLVCTDKFGKVIGTPPGETVKPGAGSRVSTDGFSEMVDDELARIFSSSGGGRAEGVFRWVREALPGCDGERLGSCLETLGRFGLEDDEGRQTAVDALTLLHDRRFDTGNIKRSSFLHLVQREVEGLLDSLPAIDTLSGSRFARVDFGSRGRLRPPQDHETTLVVDAEGFEPEGGNCDALMIVAAHKLGWKRFILYRARGQRFTGCGLGPGTNGVKIDVWGSSGDYLASGIDGLELHVHGNAQDQLGQIMKEGKLVVHGDVGQTFLYGAKGGTAFVLGNAAGRPLINAVGRPRVIINGTALDYLAESFMAGDPFHGGGFVILNGIGFDERGGSIREYETPYPGSNIFSLASGGAIYVRDPHHRLVDEQLNGGEYADLSDADWDLIKPYLEENEHLFGIPIKRLLTVDGVARMPGEVYRKIRPKSSVHPQRSAPTAGL